MTEQVWGRGRGSGREAVVAVQGLSRAARAVPRTDYTQHLAVESNLFLTSALWKQKRLVLGEHIDQL